MTRNIVYIHHGSLFLLYIPNLLNILTFIDSIAKSYLIKYATKESDELYQYLSYGVLDLITCKRLE